MQTWIKSGFDSGGGGGGLGDAVVYVILLRLLNYEKP